MEFTEWRKALEQSIARSKAALGVAEKLLAEGFDPEFRFGGYNAPERLYTDEEKEGWGDILPSGRRAPRVGCTWDAIGKANGAIDGALLDLINHEGEVTVRVVRGGKENQVECLGQTLSISELADHLLMGERGDRPSGWHCFAFAGTGIPLYEVFNAIQGYDCGY